MNTPWGNIVKIKLLVIATIIGLSNQANAFTFSSVNDYLKTKTEKGFENIFNAAYKSDKGREKFYRDIKLYIEKHPDPESIAKANELSVNITSMLFPQFSGYWDNIATWDNKLIYQNHDLYDMDRTSLPKDVEFRKSTSDSNMFFIDGSKSSISASPYGRTESLMSQGYPGVGPDGAEILICKLYDTPYSPYVEIAAHDAKALFPIIGSGSINKLCLSATNTSTYWQSRKSDFFNAFGEIIRPETTLQWY